jgi:hypothetical protein
MAHRSEGSVELASRSAGAIAVTLYWHPWAETVTVALADAMTGERFEFCVAHESALDAFHHPYAYLETASASRRRTKTIARR